MPLCWGEVARIPVAAHQGAGMIPAPRNSRRRARRWRREGWPVPQPDGLPGTHLAQLETFGPRIILPVDPARLNVSVSPFTLHFDGS
jgi:hypothetical protein